MTSKFEYTAYRLANIADCGCPDSLESPGARFLLHVQDAVNEAIEYEYGSDEDAVHEIADNAPDVYTYTRWQEFVDLAAWQEEVKEFGPIDDMATAAGVALYIIAERLASALFADVEESDDDDEEAGDDDPA